MSWRADLAAGSELCRLFQANAVVPPRIAVLAAHPDDEAIGASAVLARTREASVIYLTDGAPRDRRLWPSEFRGTREEYAELRCAEAQKCLALVGSAPEQIYRLGCVDQEAIFSASELAAALTRILEQNQFDILLTHSYEGGHPDHDAAALIAFLAIRDLEHKPELMEMTSYHARDGKCVTGEFLSAGDDEFIVELSQSDRELKAGLLQAYQSQQAVLAGFGIDRERYRSAPNYDFQSPPHAGKLWYECMGWMAGERWREVARQALAEERTAERAHK